MQQITIVRSKNTFYFLHIGTDIRRYRLENPIKQKINRYRISLKLFNTRFYFTTKLLGKFIKYINYKLQYL